MSGKKESGLGNIVAFRLDELPAGKKKQEIIRAIEAATTESAKFRLLLELQEPRSNDPGALIEDLNLLRQYRDRIERVAIIGKQAWEETWVAIAGLFGGIEVKYFDHRQKRQAHEWLAGVVNRAISRACMYRLYENTESRSQNSE